MSFWDPFVKDFFIFVHFDSFICLQFVNYHNFRENNPEYYKDVNPLDLGFIGDADILSVLPYRDQNGRRIMIFRLGNVI